MPEAEVSEVWLALVGLEALELFVLEVVVLLAVLLAGPLAAGVALLEVAPLGAELELPLVVGVVPEVGEEALVVVVPGAGVVLVVVLPAPEEVSVGLEEAVLVAVVELLLEELGELMPVFVPDEEVSVVWVLPETAGLPPLEVVVIPLPLPPPVLPVAPPPLPPTPVVTVVTPEEVTKVVVVVATAVVAAAGLEPPVTTLHSPGVVLVTPFSTNMQYGSPVASS